MFCEGDMIQIEDMRCGKIPQAIGFDMGAISNQDTRLLYGVRRCGNQSHKDVTRKASN